VTFTIAEDIQLMLKEQPDRLEYERTLTAAGVLIELTLLGRIVSTRKPGFFVTPLDRLLTVSDSTVTGQSILDVAMNILVDRDKPWRCDRALLAISRPVASAISDSLALRGLVRPIGNRSESTGYLEILDNAAVDERRSVLRRAQTLPDTVTEARLGAVIDVLRNSGNRFGGDSDLNLQEAHRWYPTDATPTIESVLKAEHWLTLSE